MKITEIRHPDYNAQISSWKKFRYILEGGQTFVEKYTQKFSVRETDTDFQTRLSYTYCPGHSRTAIFDVKNAIQQRLVDVRRIGGPDLYQEAIQGKRKGIDLQGNTLNGFIGRYLLPELLAMGKVGIYVDRGILPEEATLDISNKLQPYVYYYKAEDILSWAFNTENELVSLLLRTSNFTADDTTGLVTDTKTTYRLYKLNGNIVDFTLYDADGEIITTNTLNIPKIPFIIFQLSRSLLTDVADHQIALVNMTSSDVNYAIKGNSPFYVEQVDPMTEFTALKQAGTSLDDTMSASDHTIKAGVMQGRSYSKGLDRPAFIHPSSEPLKISMEKQDSIIKEIRQLVNVAVTNLEPQRASAESKRQDDRSLEAGLATIGLELEFGERELQNIFSLYLKYNNEQGTVKYPESYVLKTDEEKRSEVKELRNILSMLPSQTFQKEVAKEIAIAMLGSKLDKSQIDMILNELEQAPTIITDPETIRLDYEAGFVGTELASTLRGYPKGEVEQAKKDHAERLRRIAISQTNINNPKERGIKDLSE